MKTLILTLFSSFLTLSVFAANLACSYNNKGRLRIYDFTDADHTARMQHSEVLDFNFDVQDSLILEHVTTYKANNSVVKLIYTAFEDKKHKEYQITLDLEEIASSSTVCNFYRGQIPAYRPNTYVQGCRNSLGTTYEGTIEIKKRGYHFKGRTSCEWQGSHIF